MDKDRLLKQYKAAQSLDNVVCFFNKDFLFKYLKKGIRQGSVYI